jgi:hypothetical protein
VLYSHNSNFGNSYLSGAYLMKWRLSTFILLFLSLSILPGAKRKLSKPYATISRIKSPYELISNYLPKRYTASLLLSGSIADEIKSILDTLDIDMPQYSEIYNKKNRYQLIITNKGYTSQTCDLLSGILNPIELTDIILNSILQYREIENLLQMQKETIVSKKKGSKNDSSVVIYEIKPTGTRFCYKYKDMGAYIFETWLTKLSIAVEPSTMLARELSLTKHSRSFFTDQHIRPAPEVSNHRYVFNYKKIQNAPVPAQLDLYVDSILKLTLSASYRQVDRFILFDKREIKYYLKDTTVSSLLIEYTSYAFDITQEKTKPLRTSGKYTTKLKRAAACSRKAIEALNKGEIQTALGLLQTIIDNYPGTPQAVEAQKLLSGLPQGL